MPNELFLVDTSVWIFALRKNPVPQIRNRIDLLLREDVVLTTGIIKLEILAGAKTDKEYRRKGLTAPSTDILIATCALQAGAILLHADAHFDLMERVLKVRTESLVQALKKALT
jgi:predicted nucleic acid-binding protein